MILQILFTEIAKTPAKAVATLPGAPLILSVNAIHPAIPSQHVSESFQTFPIAQNMDLSN